VRADEFLVQSTTLEEKRREANLWFFLVAICQSTRTLQGTIDGRWVRGWDYLVRSARRTMRADAGWFMAERLVGVTGERLQSVFSDDGVAEHTTLDRIDERVALWQDASRLLLRRYDGDVMALYEQAHHRLRGTEGILARLAECQAYSDPVEKKSFLFIMFASRCGAWAVEDLENLRVAIDYHIMRVALRSGMVSVEASDLQRRLKARASVSPAEDNSIREAVREACELLVRYSGRSVFDIDNILWSLGRNCCFYDYEPICGEHRCWRQAQCTLIRAVTYDCPGVCPFDGACAGSRDPMHRDYWETALYTHYY
jgi:hypothetical protein